MGSYLTSSSLPFFSSTLLYCPQLSPSGLIFPLPPATLPGQPGPFFRGSLPSYILRSMPASSSLGDGDAISSKAPMICSRNADSSQRGFSEGRCPHAVACCTRTPQSVTHGTPLVCYEPLIFTEPFLLYHMYKLGREGVDRDEGENERERSKRLRERLESLSKCWGTSTACLGSAQIGGLL